MASKSEVGHAKNVSNFYDLISFVTGYGHIYNPNKNVLKLTQLTTHHAAAQSKLTNVITDNTDYNFVVNKRAVEFSDVKSLSTRLLNSLEATDASPQTIADAKMFVRKLRGKRAATHTPVDPNTAAPATISTSQQSYDQQIQHLSGLLAILESESSYDPNEDDLKIAAVTAKIKSLTTINNDVANAYTKISNSRIDRNKTLYATDTGLVAIAGEVKKYVKSIFGASSPEYAQIKGLQFKVIPN